MIAVWNDRTICDVGKIMAIGDKHFEVGKECVYLGSLVTPTNDVSQRLDALCSRHANMERSSFNQVLVVVPH
jgi:hypothetical protein